VHIFVEQPLSSILMEFEPYGTFCRFFLKYSCLHHLGSSGGESDKPIIVRSDCKEVELLQNEKSKGLKRLTSRDSNGVHGKKAALSKSQAYPKKFGHLVSQVYLKIERRQSS